MPHRLSFVTAAVLSALVGLPALAQDAFPLAEDPVLQALVQEALARSPELRAAEELHAAALQRIPQAAALPDPMLSVGYDYGGQGFAPGIDTGPTVAFAQELPWPGKRDLARSVEEKQAERAHHAAMRARVLLVYEIRKAWADLLLAREKLAVIEDQRRATRDIEELTRSRYALGLTVQADVLRAQAELARLQQMSLHEEGQRAIAEARLNGLLARPEGTPLPEGAPLRSLAGRSLRVPSREEVVARAQEMSPEVLAGATLVERSQAAVALARKRQKPDFVVASRYENRGAEPDMWKFDVGITLPLYSGRKQKRAAAEADAQLRADQALAEAMRLRTRASVESSLADYRAAVQETEAYEKGVLVVDALAVESALASFQAGKLPFISVLEAHKTLYQDHFEHVELLFHVLWHSALLDAFGMTGGGE
jgi:outer membrane protein, heavy metal efflux system